MDKYFMTGAGGPHQVRVVKILLAVEKPLKPFCVAGQSTE